MQFQHIRFEIRAFWQSAGLGVTLHERVGPDPVEKILPAIPHRKDNVRISIVYRAQYLIGNKPLHLIHQTGSLAEHLLKGVSKFPLNIKSISNSNHFAVSPDSARTISKQFSLRWF